ncbi:MAG: glycosyltransferase family 4 protein, partial [Pseudomonadota bacterium]
VSTRHNDDSFRKNPIIKAFTSCLNKKISKVITISQWIGHFVTKVERVPIEKVTPIYYGLDEIKPLHPDQSLRVEFGFSSREIVLGMIARLVEQKGHYYLIEAFSKAFEENPNLRLLIVGDGELKAALQNQVHKKKLDRVIRFTGYRNDITDVLSALDIFVHPSLWEGFGLAILEAMAMGKPVIATSISAIPELVENEVTGLLVPPKEIQSLAQAIAKLSLDASMRKAFGQNAQERWKRLFSTDSMVEKTENLYSELLQHSLRGSGETRTYGT